MIDFANMNDRERAILNSAYQVFTEKGYHNAKVSEIAKLAGVGKGTIYEYFDSKEALLRGVIQIGMLYYLDKIRKGLLDSHSFWEKVTNIFKTHADFLKQHSAFKKVIGDHFSIINKEFHDWMLEQRNEYLKLVNTIVEEGVRAGELQTNRTDWTAKYILASLNSFNDAFSENSYSDEQVKFVLKALKNGLC